MTIAGDILRETAELVDGDRNATHGDKTSSFTVIAEFWQIYLDGRKKHDDPLCARDVAMMMTLLKVARSIQGEPVQEHFKDAAGYCAIGAECALVEQRLDKMLKAALASIPAKVPAPETLTVPEDIWPCGCYRMDGEVGGCSKCSGVRHG